MGDRPESFVPKLSGTIDPARMRTLPLGPTDGYLLSRIDGISSIEDLASAMGLDVEDVVVSIIKLEALGLVTMPKTGTAAATKEKAKAPSTPRPPPKRRSVPPRRSSPPPRAPSPPSERSVRAAAPVRPAATPAPVVDHGGAKGDDAVDLEPDHQKEIDEIFAKLGELDHYALLGIDSTADRKAIKRAYFEATGHFHPDRFFRKKLGPFKAKMEVIFVRMTEAHDTLTRDQRRAEYDAYLGSIDKSRLIEQLLANVTSEVKKVEDAGRAAVSPLPAPPPPPSSPATPPSGPFKVEMPTQPRIAFQQEPTTSSGVPSERPSSRSFEGTEPSTSTRPMPTTSGFPSEPSTRVGRPRISVASITDEMADPKGRRDMLARRLTGSPPRPSAPPPAPPAPSPAEAVDALKRRYEDKVAAARAAQNRKLMENVAAAREKGDVVGAANALRHALAVDPENAELKAAHEEAQRAADRLLSDQYTKQADYEEKAEKWADAARSWRRVARAREADAKAHERAAHCLLRADGDLHEASTLAQKAVQLAPKELQPRVTLAKVYLAAGLAKNAKRELEAAAALAPNDATVIGLLKGLGKQS